MATTYQRPGVFVNEVLTALHTGNGATAEALGAFLAAANRGPTTPTLVNNWSDFVRLFGDFSNSTYLAQALFSYFANGGGQAYVCRVATASATVATRTVNDTAATPQPTLKISATNPGAWGNSIFIDILAGYTSGRFDLVVKYGGSATANTVETFSDLSMDTGDPRYAVAIVNAQSHYVVLVDQLSSTAAPNNAPAPQAGTALATGADGTAPAASDYQTAVGLFSTINQPLVLNCPGVTDAATVNDVLTWAESQGTVFVVVDTPQGETVSGVTAYASTLNPTSFGGAYFPWLVTNDPTRTAPGITKTIPPGGAVVGQFIASDAAEGPFKTPAGVSTQLSGVVSLETALQAADYDTLNTSAPPVNVIKPVPGYGVCVFAGRTLKGGYADKYVAVRRSLIYVEQSLKNLTQFAVFEPNDGRLWNRLTTVCTDFLTDYWARGGLRGSSAQQAFYVVCDESNNTLVSIQNGQVNIEVGVALQYPAEFIVIRLGQYEGGTSLTTTL